MGRTIPNMLVLPFGEISISYESYVTLNAWPAVNIALSLLLGCGSGAGRALAIPASWTVALLTFAAVVIRIEFAGLLDSCWIAPYLSRVSSRLASLTALCPSV